MADSPVFPWHDIDARRQRLYEQYERYYERRCEEAYRRRGERWERDFSSPEAYCASVQPNRERFRQMLGGWPWPREGLKPRRELLAETSAYTLERVWLTAFEDVEIDCLLLTPPGDEPRPAVLAQHGLNGTPEDACGFIDNAEESLYRRIGIRLAERGYVVIAPHMVGGYGTDEPGASHVPEFAGQVWGRARTQLYRRAMQIGERLYGAELFSLSRAVDFLQTLPAVDAERIGMYGLSQGGMSALWFPALDERIRATVMSAYFNSRYDKQLIPGEHYTCYLRTEEEEKHFAGQLSEFADSDIASLICPRAMFVEAGKQDGAVYWELALKAFDEVKEIYKRLGIPEKAEIGVHDGGHECRGIESIAFLDRWLSGGRT